MVTAREAYESLGISRSAFYRLTAAGAIPSVKAGPKSTRYRVGDLRAFVRERTEIRPPSDGLPARSRARRRVA